MSIHCQSLLSPRQARTLFTHTQTTYHNWIRSDYYTLSQLLSMYKKTAQLSDLTYANLTQMSNQDSYNSLYRHKLPGQSDTSPILRWTGNSPIWGKITVLTRGFIYIWLPHTHTADCSARTTKSTTGESVYLYHPTHTNRHNVCSPERKRSTAWSTVIYSSNY